MTILTTNAEILDYALDVADEPQDASSDFYTQAIVFLNSIYRQICAGGVALNPEVDEQWVWLRSETPAILTLLPSFIAGTISVTNNSASAVLSAPPAYSLAGWIFNAPGDNGDFYRISAHTAGNANITLDSVYTGDTNAAASVRASKLIYTLPAGIREVIGAMYSSQLDDKIEGVDPDVLRDRYPYTQMTSGVPEAYAMISTGKVQFSGPPGDRAQDMMRLEFDYLASPTDLADDSNQPLIPLEYREVLANFTAFYILQDKHDSKADTIGKLAQAGLLAMQAENQRRQRRQGAGSFGQIYPRANPGGRKRRGPVRSVSGYIIG